MRYDVVSIGEPVIDFVERARSSDGNPMFEALPGGGAVNVLSQVVAFGGRAALIGVVGEDAFGDFLVEKLRQQGISIASLRRTSVKNTGIGFNCLGDRGESDFTFYRNPEKEVRLFMESDVDFLMQATLLHFTSVSLAGPALRASTFEAVVRAKEMGIGVSFDINHRPALWGGALAEVREVILSAVEKADVVKLSETEREYLFGSIGNADCAKRLHGIGVRCVAVSMGCMGSYFSYAGGEGYCRSMRIEMVDPTGCGDAFIGAFLIQLARRGGVAAISDIPLSEMRGMVTIANTAGALCASRIGSFTVMPTEEEVQAALQAGLLE